VDKVKGGWVIMGATPPYPLIWEKRNEKSFGQVMAGLNEWTGSRTAVGMGSRSMEQSG